MPAEMPGTMRKGTPAAARLKASSPPRPKTMGSPPLRRSTLLPSRAKAMLTSGIAGTGTGKPDPAGGEGRQLAWLRTHGGHHNG